MSSLRLIIVCALLSLASLMALTKALDDYGYQFTDEALKRSLVAFGVARGINGLISVAQEAEIAMQPAGVGLTLSPGEVLDPVNDLIERFSVVMLISASALGVQKLLLSISAWSYFNLLVAFFWLALAVVSIWRFKQQESINKRWLQLALFLVLVRFATPIMALTSQGVYQIFLQQDYIEAQQGLEQVTQNLEQETQKVKSDPNQSFIDKAQDWFSETVSELDIQKQIDSYKEAAEQTSKDVVQLITVFIVQTILFPLFFLWLLVKFAKWLIASLFATRRPIAKT